MLKFISSDELHPKLSDGSFFSLMKTLDDIKFKRFCSIFNRLISNVKFTQSLSEYFATDDMLKPALSVISEAIRSGPDLGSILRGVHSQLTLLLTETERLTVIMTKSQQLIDPIALPKIRDQSIIPVEAQLISKQSTNWDTVSIFKNMENVGGASADISTIAANVIALHTDTIHMTNNIFV